MPVPKCVNPVEGPNQLKAMPSYFADLLPSLIGLSAAVLTIGLTEDFGDKAKFKIFSLDPQVVIAALTVTSAYLFYKGVQYGYLSNSNNIAEMGAEERKYAYGCDPFEYYDKGMLDKSDDQLPDDDKNKKAWSILVKNQIDRAREYSNYAVICLSVGSILLFSAIGILLYAYEYYILYIFGGLLVLHLILQLFDLVKHKRG
jgi:hypothetical protein